MKATSPCSAVVPLTAHLLPLVGINGMMLAMVLLSRAVATTGTGRLWARLTARYDRSRNRLDKDPAYTLAAAMGRL